MLHIRLQNVQFGGIVVFYWQNVGMMNLTLNRIRPIWGEIRRTDVRITPVRDKITIG